MTLNAKITGVVAAVAMLATPQAEAALDLVFNNGNAAISGYPGPYGTLNLTLTDSTHVNVTLTANPGFSFGTSGTLGLNLNSAATVVGGVAGITGNAPSYTLDPGASLNGWGAFNFVIDSFDGFNDSSTLLTFSLVKTTGTWASEADILTGNASGYLAAGHVFVWNGNNGPGSGVDALATGYSTAAPVPEPTTVVAGALLLLPFAVSTIRFIRKRRTA